MSPGEVAASALLARIKLEPYPMQAGRLKAQLTALLDEVISATALIEQGAVSIAHEKLVRAIGWVR